MAHTPIVLVPACNRQLGEHPFHVAGHKYTEAVRLAGAIPLVVPGLAPDEIGSLLERADGVLLTGSPSNVHPRHFNEEVLDPTLPLDPQRDALTLPLIRAVLACGMPLLGICRGAQEANVALGGSLHQAVHQVEGHADHRGAGGAPGADAQALYAPAHAVDVNPGGLLDAIVGKPRFEVNSVHGQGIRRLADGLRVEARAPDGLIEAFSLASPQPAAASFMLCVQWHPEWQARANPVSMRLFEAFGVAVRGYRDRVRGPLPSVATHA